MDNESISSSDRAENWSDRTRFCSAFFSLSEATGLGGTWGLLEGVERLGCENPSTSTRTPSTLTLVGEHLEDNESSFEAAVFKGPAEPLGALLEGAAEPLDAISWGLAEPLEAVLGGSAEPLSVSEEHLRTRTEPGRRPIPSSTSQRKPECRSIPIRVRQKKAR